MNPVTVTPTTHEGLLGTDLGTMSTDRALPVAVPVADQHQLLADLEARLTNEVLDLISALNKFSAGTQAICEELPLSSHLGKHVTGFLSAGSFQIAYALFKGRNKPLLLDDGVQQLLDMGLELKEFARELDLDGRRFLAVAFVDQRDRDILQRQ